MKVTQDCLIWREGHPFSTIYGDFFYSTTNPPGESRYVFFEGNGLPQRWLDPPAFTIAETGFGTGLNLLTALHLFAVAPWRRLTYVSWEKHPMTRTTLARIHAQWPALAGAAAALQAVYPQNPEGLVEMLLPQFRLRLLLICADVKDGLGGLPNPADAWFLDGFAPRCNEDMWDEQLLLEIGKHTACGGRFATYTAAGAVKRGLQAAGFQVFREPGFAEKRHMLRGQLA